MIYFSQQYRFAIFLLLALVAACASPSSDSSGHAQLIETVGREFAPDKRVAIFDIREERRHGQTVLLGETNLPAAHRKLLDEISKAVPDLVDSVVLLPAPELGDRKWALVNNSVANIRSKNRHSAELATQALLGTPLNVLKRVGSFTLVQTPDGYIGWVDSGAIVRVDAGELKRYKNSTRVVFMPVFGFAKASPGGNAVVSDLVSGTILEKTGQSGTFFEVRYPDGRRAFVSMGEALDYADWVTGMRPDEQSLIKEARKLLGVPYLWGGTSTKGMDCSGFTKTIYLMNGMILPRDASQQVFAGETVDESGHFENLKAGDLLFFGRAATDSTRERVVHVGMWIGNGEYIHASGRVRINSMDPKAPNFDEYNLKRYLRTRRMLGQQNSIAYLREGDLFQQIRLPE